MNREKQREASATIDEDIKSSEYKLENGGHFNAIDRLTTSNNLGPRSPLEMTPMMSNTISQKMYESSWKRYELELSG